MKVLNILLLILINNFCLGSGNENKGQSDSSKNNYISYDQRVKEYKMWCEKQKRIFDETKMKCLSEKKDETKNRNGKNIKKNNK